MLSFLRLGGAVLAVSLFAARPAHAEPANESKPTKRDTEITVVPFIGGNSDVGLGGGYIASVAGVAPAHEPYVYRVESAGTMTFQREGDGVRVPYVDNYLLLTLPHVVKDRVRLEARISYTREATLKYYGLGNASTVEGGRDPNSAYFEHVRVHPTFVFNGEWRREEVRFNWGFTYIHNTFEIPEDSRLAEDMRSGSEHVRRLLGAAETHGSLKLSAGAGLDTRDDEVSPQKGSFHTIRTDLSPGSLGERATIGRWGRVNAAVRFYETLIDRRLVFAFRLLGDFLFGDAPFYELPRFDETFAIGGAKGVRGVPAQRYYGKIKTFTNVELRSELFDFELFGDRRRVGLTGFGDFGRSWSDYESDPELDGEGLGLKYGLGGGLRVASGKAFVLRLDVAWSPDADPVSGYLISGHHF
jgi:outer membrane protein assembly factor BamA